MPTRTIDASAAALLTLALAALPTALNAQPVGQSLPAGATESIAAGHLLVAAKAGMPDSALAALAREHGGQGIRAAGNGALRFLDVPAGSERAVLARLQRHPHLRFAELDRRVPPSLMPNDPYMGSAWHLGRIGAPTAWDNSLGQGVIVAVLDSGLDANHPEFAGRLVSGWNFYGNNADTSDVQGHGTAVAGAVAAATNNGQGVAGVAGAARIMPLRISDATGWASYSAMASALTWAADRGARVANLSYVAAGSAAVRDASAYFKSKGGLVFSSAGNYGSDAGIAATNTMIPVSATGPSDGLASWSSWGSHVALAAPGEGIYTTNVGGGYSAWSGTSFSSPVAAGVAALMMSARPTLPAATIESLLFQTALDLGSAGRDTRYGHGRVQAAAAVAAALAATTPTVDTQAPQVAIGSPAGGASVSGLVAVDVAASDNVGVARVELLVGNTVVATDTQGPFGFVWDSSTRANGSASLVARAYDAAGNSANSAAVVVNVANAVVPDTSAPVVTVASPLAGAFYRPGVISIRASASDDRGVVSMTVAIDGATVQQQSGASVSMNWNARKVSPGAHSVTVSARDAAGNTSTKSVVVTIQR